ncbi:MAG: sensor histidine kinase [Acidimicrobiales bacterium]
MTFRSRLVVAAAVAVVIAVLGACAAAYVASRDSLVGSIDGTLRTTARTSLERTGQLSIHTNAPGLDFQFVTPGGTVLTAGGATRPPVTSKVRAVAAGRAPGYFDTVTLGGVSFRELVVYAGTVPFTTGFGATYRVERVALQLVLPLSSVDQQLAHLRLVLAGVAAAGVAVAAMLAWLVGRTALVPLNDLTGAVEEVAATTDMSRRLDPGGPDELGRLRRAFNHLLAALERSQQSQRQLVVDAGHELRTPLTSLRTNLELVRRMDELPSGERTVLVDDLLTQMGELTQLVADLSELARGDGHRREPVLFRLDQLVEEAVAAATTHGRVREVGYRLAVAAEPAWLRGQPDRVARAVGNLLDNALKWSPDGGLVDVTCAGGAVTVRDRGPGIPPEDLPHIFDRFYRSSAARRLPGSGLGLAIVAQVAEAEGGTVTAGPALDGGGGAVLRLQLPVVGPPVGGPDAELGDGLDDDGPYEPPGDEKPQLA